MFGFQPTPTAGSPWRTSNWVFPPPPPPPTCPQSDCNANLYWYPFSGTYEVFVGATPPIINLLWSVFIDAGYNNRPDFCLEFSLENGNLPPGLILSGPVITANNIGCGAAGDYTVTIGVKPFQCYYYTPVTTDITFHYSCAAAIWLVDPIVINASVNSIITLNLANYVSNTYKLCNQNYYYYGDGGNWSQNDNIVTTSFSVADTYYSSATVSNNCQDVSANTVGIQYNIT
jgi:hypothetical protein